MAPKLDLSVLKSMSREDLLKLQETVSGIASSVSIPQVTDKPSSSSPIENPATISEEQPKQPAPQKSSSKEPSPQEPSPKPSLKSPEHTPSGTHQSSPSDQKEESAEESDSPSPAKKAA